MKFEVNAESSLGLWYLLPVLVFARDPDFNDWSLSVGWLKWGVTATLKF